MNDQDFILLMEEYFDGSLPPDKRAALRAEVAAHPERRRLFEEQARQNVRIHAQTSRVDFTESQRIAVMAMDIAEKHHEPAAFIELLREQTLRERFRAIRHGLRAPRGSGPHRYARFAMWRMFCPPAVSLTVSAAIILLLAFWWIPKVLRPTTEQEDPITIDLRPPPTERTPDPTPPAPTPEPVTPFSVPELTPSVLWQGPEVPITPPSPITLPPSNPPRLTSLTSSWPPGTPSDTPFVERHPFPTNMPTAPTNLPPTESCVYKALRWLKENQLDDGSWAGQEPTAMSGLAILAFLGHGEKPGTVLFGNTVEKGLRFLLTRQGADGAFSSNAYAHAIAAYAVCEARALTRIEELRAPMERAIARIIAGQQSGGGYDYGYGQGPRFDTSVSGWQIQALKAASIAGAGNPDLPAALGKATRFLQTQAFARDGSGFVYEGKDGLQPDSGARWTMTGVGALCLQFLGKSDTAQVRISLNALRDVTFDWNSKAKPSLYGYYYVTQAKFQQSKRAIWSTWNVQMQKALISRQHADGHWENGDYDQGSHVYTTTLCTLMLEVYYRYLPTYGKVAETGAPETAPSEEVTVHVQ